MGSEAVWVDRKFRPVEEGSSEIEPVFTAFNWVRSLAAHRPPLTSLDIGMMASDAISFLLIPGVLRGKRLDNKNISSVFRMGLGFAHLGVEGYCNFLTGKNLNQNILDVSGDLLKIFNRWRIWSD